MPRPATLTSPFFSDMLAANQAGMRRFKRWLFEPGMLFNARQAWWGEKKSRPTPHKGLDLCAFEEVDGRNHPVDGKIRIPATFAGEIIKIGPDFLGQSIYLRHEIFSPSPSSRQLWTIYGHTRPLPPLRVGDRVEQGQILAAVAEPPPASGIPPHLHLTFAWVPRQLQPERLSWQNLGRDEAITLIDPLWVLAPQG
jgi:hypothetical protein